MLLLKVFSPNDSIWKTTFKFLLKLNFYVANLAYLEIVCKISIFGVKNKNKKSLQNKRAHIWAGLMTQLNSFISM